MVYLVYNGFLTELTSSLGVEIQRFRISGDDLNPALSLVRYDVNHHLLPCLVGRHQVERVDNGSGALHQENLVNDATEVGKIAAIYVFFLQLTDVLVCLEFLKKLHFLSHFLLQLG